VDRSGPGHFFTMWGFTILLLTIVEAYGTSFRRPSTSPGSASGTGSASWRTSSPSWSWSPGGLLHHPLKNAPSRKERQSRFYGSHLDAAWITLAMIAGVIITLLLYRPPRSTPSTPPVPLRWGAFASHAIAKLLHPAGPDQRRPGTIFLILNVAVISGFIVFVPTPSTCTSSWAINVAFSRRPGLGPSTRRRHGHGERGRGHRVRWGVGTSAGSRCSTSPPHRVRALPVGLPGLEHREAPVAKLLIMGLRDNMFASATQLLGARVK